MIIPEDIIFKLSGGASNANPYACLGGARSSVTLVNTLFPTVDAPALASGSVEYLCVYIYNNNSVTSFLNSKLWIAINTPSAFTTIDVGLGTSAVNGVEQTIADIFTAPTGVTFSAPSTLATALAVDDVPAGQHKALWLRRTVTAGAGVLDNDGCTIMLQCD